MALIGDSRKLSAGSGEVEIEQGGLIQDRISPPQAQKKLDVKLALEAAVLIAILLVVWTLLSLPIVFYHLSVDNDVS